MAAVLGAALVIGAITACVGPLYYCKQSSQGREINNDESSEVESPLVRIKISHPHRGKPENRARGNGYDETSDENSINSNEDRETRDNNVNEIRLPSRESHVVPVKPPRNRRKFHQNHTTLYDEEPLIKRISNDDRKLLKTWTSATSQLQNTGSSEAREGKTVRTQVEVYPRNSVSSNYETPDSRKHESYPRDDVCLEKSTSTSGPREDEKSRKLTTAVTKKWRHLKRSLICSRSNKSIIFKEMEEDDETQRLGLPVPVTSQRSPMGHSTMLHKNRLVDASTSTRISTNIHESRGNSSHEIVRNNGISDGNDCVLSTGSQLSEEDRRYSNAEILQDVMTLIKRRSIDGKQVCDVRITGLTMSQSELLDLFEATGDKNRAASIVTTEESSVISIKLHKDSPKSHGFHEEIASLFEIPLRKIHDLSKVL